MKARALLAVVAAGVLGTGTAARAQAAQETPPPLPAPGRLIDIGGWRLHLDCTGQSRPAQPTVILEAGAGDFSVEWALVQPEVARFARVCSYDRAGDGWSELGPHPRTFHQVAWELHTLLAAAGERPPYLLVGHSYGAWLVREYQVLYPGEVAGLVLLDGGADDPLRMLADGRVVRASELAAGEPVPPVKTSGPLRAEDVPPAAMAQIKLAARDGAAQPNDGPRSKLPANARVMRSWALARWQHIAAAVNPFENDELAALRALRLNNDHYLGGLPLIVVARGRPEEEGPAAAAREAQHRQDEAVLAELSTRGELVVATSSGHHIHLEQPQLVVSAIRRALAAAR